MKLIEFIKTSNEIKNLHSEKISNLLFFNFYLQKLYLRNFYMKSFLMFSRAGLSLKECFDGHENILNNNTCDFSEESIIKESTLFIERFFIMPEIESFEMPKNIVLENCLKGTLIQKPTK